MVNLFPETFTKGSINRDGKSNSSEGTLGDGLLKSSLSSLNLAE